jgi:hypothetical protein
MNWLLRNKRGKVWANLAEEMLRDLPSMYKAPVPGGSKTSFFNKILLGYIHDMGGFIVTIPLRLTLYIIYIAPIISPPQPPPHPTYSNCKGFSVLFHTGIWSLSTIYCHLKILPSPFPHITYWGPFLMVHINLHSFQFFQRIP